MQGQERIVPELPPAGRRLRLIIDTDAANEIDDLYAVALALRSPDRFAIEGFVATHFAQTAGRASIEASHRVLIELLAAAGGHHAPVLRGGDPLPYRDQPSPSEGADFIIERAHAGGAEDPLWVVGIGAASNLASAILKDPSILPKVRFVYHARSEQSWPRCSEQFNVFGDLRAVQVLLESAAPLVWFDTGQQLTCPMETTAARLAPLGPLGEFLHAYRRREKYFQYPDKGFFDLGDIGWMIQPDLCTEEVLPVPRMDWMGRFVHEGRWGNMRRVSGIRAEPTWELFFARMGG